jgi:hypothetical protein
MEMPACRASSSAPRCGVEPAPGEAHEFGECRRGLARVGQDDGGHVGHDRDRRERRDRIEGHGAVEELVHGEVVGRPQQQHRAVGRRGDDGGGADIAARAGPRLHEHRAGEQGGQLLGEQARDDVAGAARREGDDEPQRGCALRPGVCGEGGGAGREQGAAARRGEVHQSSILIRSCAGRTGPA